MTLIKKRNVHDYFSSRRLARKHAFIPASKPDATGYSGPGPGANGKVPSEFAKDFLGEHSSPGKSIPPSAEIALPCNAAALQAPGSVQA